MNSKVLHIAFCLTALLMMACTSDDKQGDRDDTQQFTLDVVEQPWEEEKVAISRSGETLEGLRATTGEVPLANGLSGFNYGFGIYCSTLAITNTQVTWDNVNGRWKIGSGYNTYWRRDVSGTLDIYAYAPYKTEAYSVSSGVLTFNAAKYAVPGYTDKLSGNDVDLLYASQTGYARNSTEPAKLTFEHALAKMTFGTITNNTGGALNLNGFTISGTLHSQAKLNLATGVWSEHVSSATEISAPPPFIYVANTLPPPDPLPSGYIGFVYISPLADKETIIPPMPNRELSFIPDANGRITLTIKINSNNVNEEFSFPVTLEKGKNKTYNITIGKNYEVIIN